jgi:hypothetical protein
LGVFIWAVHPNRQIPQQVRRQAGCAHDWQSTKKEMQKQKQKT